MKRRNQTIVLGHSLALLKSLNPLLSAAGPSSLQDLPVSTDKVTEFLDTSGAYLEDYNSDPGEATLVTELELGQTVEVSSEEAKQRRKKERKEKKREKKERRHRRHSHRRSTTSPPPYASSISSCGAPKLKLQKYPLVPYTEDLSKVENRSVASSMSVGEMFQKSPVIVQPVACISPVKPLPVEVERTPEKQPATSSPVKTDWLTPPPSAPTLEGDASEASVYAWGVADAAARTDRDGPPKQPLGGRVVLNDYAHRRKWFVACSACPSVVLN